MKVIEKEKAVELRKQGKSYNFIKENVKVSSSTLSLWLRDIKVDHIEEYRKKSESARDGIINCWKNKRKIVLENYIPDFENPKFMLGLGVYLGEGNKSSICETQLSNSDPSIAKIFINWIEEFFKNDYEYIDAAIHHYEPDNDKNVLEYWQKSLNSNIIFKRSIFAISKTTNLKRQTLKYGTIHLRVGGKGNWVVKQKIRKAIELFYMTLT